ncbi:adenine-specific methyltransferase EcoRI family protein, partial [Alistipes putredinis]|uniref:adenine-specific methyltransferase EcoRI family protein n=1 Tax=Alistipes putredinis TaxID=28117 RepID=UPI0036F2B781
VAFTDAIPSDYGSVMDVPISYLDKYCPEQIEILGMCENEDLYSMKTRVYTTYECKTAYLKKFGKTGTYDLNASGVITRNGIQEKVYQRILIINRKFAPNS